MSFEIAASVQDTTGRKISDQQVTLLGDARRVAKP
jgi:hypothetical protein